MFNDELTRNAKRTKKERRNLFKNENQYQTYIMNRARIVINKANRYVENMMNVCMYLHMCI